VQIKPDEITSILKQRIEGLEDGGADLSEVGTVLSVADGISRVHGLDNCMSMELLELPHDVTGLALNLESDNVGAVLFGEWDKIEEGDQVKRTGRLMEVPVGEELLGRIVDPLGNPLDGKGEINTEHTRPAEFKAPGVVQRQPVKEPMMTGIKPIDAMTNVGRGQRELIIGDRQTGKTSICIDTIINNKGKDLVCVYVAIACRPWWRSRSSSTRTARSTTPSSSPPRPTRPHRSSSWPPMRAPRLPSISSTTASTRWRSTTT
jgi:F-type H+-transporting ATPase subunit alpha